MSPTLTYSHWRVDGKTFVWVAEHYPDLSAAVFPADKMVSGWRHCHLRPLPVGRLALREMILS